MQTLLKSVCTVTSLAAPSICAHRGWAEDAESSCSNRSSLCRDFAEATQRFDLIVERRHAIHRIEHHEIRAEPTPAFSRCTPALRIALVHAKPAFDAERCSVATTRSQF